MRPAMTHRIRLWFLATVWLWMCSMPSDAQETEQRAQRAQRYWSDTWRGWHFYEEPAQEVPQPRATRSLPAPGKAATPPAPTSTPPISTPPGAPAPRPPEIAAFEQLQKALEEARTIAIMRPIEANVRRYMEIESRVVARASEFADMAQKVAWSTPQLDPTLQGRPVGAKALEVFERKQFDERSRSITNLGQDHVLLFFYRSDCPYCHAFSPVLQTFRDRHGIRVVAVSIDGGPLPGFADARADNGIATTLQVTQVPAVYLAQPFTGRISPIGFGILSESQLLERITQVAAATTGMSSTTSAPLPPSPSFPPLPPLPPLPPISRNSP